LAEVLEISVDVISSEAFKGKSPLVQIEEEMPDVPVPVLPRCQRQPAFLALDLEEILEPRMIAARWRGWIVCQAAEPLQKAASNGAEVLLRPVRSGGPCLRYAARCPASGDSLKVSSLEAMLSGPALDLLGDA
jgi:hypothetical protein